MCILSDALLEARGTTEVTSTPKPLAEKPPSTPDVDACEAEEMVNSMLRDSPLPEAERGNEKLPEEEGGEKLPEGGDEKPLEETPRGKLVMPFIQFPFALVLLVFVTQVFL